MSVMAVTLAAVSAVCSMADRAVLEFAGNHLSRNLRCRRELYFVGGGIIFPMIHNFVNKVKKTETWPLVS